MINIQQSAYVIYEWPHRKIFPVCPFTLDDLQFRRYLNDFAMVLTSSNELEKAECFKPVRFCGQPMEIILVLLKTFVLL